MSNRNTRLKTVALDQDLELILISALRYAMGRATYVPETVMNFVRPLLPYMTLKSLYVIESDIKEEFSRCERLNLYLPYEDEWIRFVLDVRSEKEKKGSSNK